MLKEKDLTLLKAGHICRAAEVSAQQNEAWSHADNQIAVVKKSQQRVCTKCNRSHARARCPAFGKTCFVCKGKNHFAMCCTERQVDDVHEDSDDFSVLDVKICNVNRKEDWTVTAQVAGQMVVLKVDTGSQANLLPYSVYRRCKGDLKLHPSCAVLRSYSGGVIKHVGVATLQVEMNHRSCRISFFVVKKSSPAILGLAASETLGLVSRNVDTVIKEGTSDIMKEFPDLFQGTGCLHRQYHMVLRKDSVPVVMPARRVPLALRGPLRDELDRMERGGIIQKVSAPTDWVSPLVIVRKKNRKLRLCMYPQNINDCLKREHYQMPRREDIEAELAGAQYFSRLDANSGFHQIPLDNATSNICTFSTPFGRYRFLRLPFGIAAAPEVFQKAMSEIFDRAAGVQVYVDDVLIYGATKDEHDARLRHALQLSRQAGLTFNADKCKIGLTEIDFLGDVISKEGIKPNPLLSKALGKLPDPVDKAAIHRMLGVANYFGKFIPNLADKTNLLRSLLKKQINFEWTENHAREWAVICEHLSKPPLLAIFDASRETKISADASKCGLGAALLQRDGDAWRPVAYASRAMSAAEQRYSQIEKEAMGITYGCEKFHQFVYGRKIVIETDHRPLIAIATKAIGDMPPRLQRFFLRLFT